MERTEDNHDLLRHLRVLNSSLLIAIGLCPLLGSFWSLYDSVGFTALYSATFVAWSSIVLLLRSRQNATLAGRLACAVLYMLTIGSAFLLGGADSFSLAWLMVVPVAAAVCVGHKDLWFWTFISASTAIVFGWIHELGPPGETTGALPGLSGSASVTSLVAGVIVVAILTSVWHSFQSDLANRLDQSLGEARTEARKNGLLVEIATVSSREDSVDAAAEIYLSRLRETFQVSVARYWHLPGAGEKLELRYASDSASPDVAEDVLVQARAIQAGADVLPKDDGASILCIPVQEGVAVRGVLEVRGDEKAESLSNYREIVVQMALRLGEVALREAAARAVWKEAHHDHLTRLPNRRAFRSVLRRILSADGGDSRRTGLLFVDLNGFKRINDNLGHAAGDEVLRQVSRRLMRSLRLTDALCTLNDHSFGPVSRVGGDEFTILLDEILEGSDAEIVARRVITALEQPIELESGDVHVGASIGIAIYPDDANSADDLVRCADSAMYVAKRRQETGYARYQPDSSGFDEAAFELDLCTAFENGSIEMHYQPVFNCLSGAIVGAEALMRWHDPERGTISPATFIPIAERLGLTRSVGEFQFDHCFAWLEAAKTDLPDGFRLSLNLSAGQLEDASLIDGLVDRLLRAPIDLQTIELEMTEAVLLSSAPEVQTHLSRIAELGVGIALEDFGASHASSSLLKDFPIRRIKLDRAFVAGLPDCRDDVAIFRSIIGLCESIGIPLVADGVDDEAQHEFLTTNRCDEMQGYLLARPLPGDDLISLYGVASEDRPAPDPSV